MSHVIHLLPSKDNTTEEAYTLSNIQTLDEPTAHTWQEDTQQHGLVQCLWHKELDMAAFVSHRKNGEATAETRTECTNAEHMEHRLHEIMCLRCREKSKKKSTNQSVIRWRSSRHFFEMKRKRQQCQANIELKQLTRHTLNDWREELSASLELTAIDYFLCLHEIDMHLFLMQVTDLILNNCNNSDLVILIEMTTLDHPDFFLESYAGFLQSFSRTFTNIVTKVILSEVKIRLKYVSSGFC